MRVRFPFRSVNSRRVREKTAAGLSTTLTSVRESRPRPHSGRPTFFFFRSSRALFLSVRVFGMCFVVPSGYAIAGGA